MPELEIPEPRPGALICWPVHWDKPNEGPAPKVEGIHITAMYWPEVIQTKGILLRAFEQPNSIYRGYTVVKVEGPAAFGVLNDYPVLKIDNGSYGGIRHERTLIKGALVRAGIDDWDKRFEFNPHCSVDLITALEPPKRLILGPPELWYKDDEPVKI